MTVSKSKAELKMREKCNKMSLRSAMMAFQKLTRSAPSPDTGILVASMSAQLPKTTCSDHMSMPSTTNHLLAKNLFLRRFVLCSIGICRIGLDSNLNDVLPLMSLMCVRQFSLEFERFMKEQWICNSQLYCLSFFSTQCTRTSVPISMPVIQQSPTMPSGLPQYRTPTRTS